MDACFHGAIAAIRQDFSIEIADTQRQIREAQHLRYQVFCRERHIFTGSGNTECDEFDDLACHILIRRRETGQVVGTTRLITSHPSAGAHGFPMQKVTGAELFRHIPTDTTGEISRFALSKSGRDLCRLSDCFIRLGLMQGLVRASNLLGLTHWCAALEPSLLRLLKSASIHFQSIGPLVEYRGLRQPVIGNIDTILARGRWERPELWDFVTESERQYAVQLAEAA